MGCPMKHSAQPLAPEDQHPHFSGPVRSKVAGEDQDPHPQGVMTTEMPGEFPLSPAHLQSNFHIKGWVHSPTPEWSVLTAFQRTPPRASRDPCTWAGTPANEELQGGL